ncbi:MAG TPA: adenylate/guanylate cyclase domain-containing protein [Candidatus Angelobacter sp.]|nr:adenylate/guanylate cyclase domain-containing protein [Candidatus Angelobacter sp.]
MKRWLDILIPGLLLLAATDFSLQGAAVVDRLRNMVFDSYQQFAPRRYRSELPVRIIDIDEESLQHLGQWPWPRDVVARLVDRLGQLGAKAVGLDLIFAEPDRFSPANLARVWQDRPELASLRAGIALLPDSDAILADSLRHTPSVTAFARSDSGASAAPASKAGFAETGDNPRLFVPPFTRAVTTLPPIEAAAAGNGCANYIPDADNTVRRVPLLFAFGDKLYPGFAAEALRVAQGASSYVVKSSGASKEWKFGASTGIAEIKIGNAIVPTDAAGQVLLHDTGHVPGRFIPAWRVLSPDFDAGKVSGMIVLIGTSAEALKDIRTTPLAPVMPGVEIHAQVIEQILAQDFLRRPDWIAGAETLGFVVLGIVLIFAIRSIGALWSLLIALLAGGGAVAVSRYGFSRLGYLIDPLYPCLVVLLVYLSGSVIAYLKTEQEKRAVRSVFSRYLSPVRVDELIRHPERQALGGELRDLTFLFSDIRGFTRIAERLDPQALTGLINRFLTRLTDVIHQSGGTIDKYMGDCVMAFWNAPLDIADHGRKAIEAALAMRTALDRLNGELAEEARRDGRALIVLRAGIGLNSGRGCVGNMGSEQRMAYSVIGDAVNIASRLEGLSRAYGVDIVMGEDTARFADDFALLELDLVRVKGRDTPLRIFTALGRSPVATGEEFKRLQQRHTEMLAAYRRQDWSAAHVALAFCRPLAPALAVLYDVYEQRIAEFETSPPPPDWDGVFTATTKQG